MLLKDSPASRNVFNTLFYCHQIDSYMERHSIFEILGELMVRVCIDRPENVVEYLCQKLIEIAQKYIKNVVKLEFFNSEEEGSKMLKTLSAQHQIPVIECVNREISSSEFHNRIDKFLKSNLLNSKRLIICDFKESNKNDRTLRITRNTNSTTSQPCFFKPQDSIDIQLTEELFSPCQVNYIYQNICNMKPKSAIKGNWNCRALIVGRVGAGRKTQGELLAREFGLKFIDLDYLVVQYHHQATFSEKTDFGFWGFVQETLLKPNCLDAGYVMVGSVISSSNLEILMEKFIYQPNRIIFLHTSERECWRRLSTKGILQTLANPRNRNVLFNYQMNLYDLHKKEFVEYFRSSRHKIFHMNGNKAIHEITTLMWANLVC